ncbi:flagellar hook-basal body complex protein FliE [Candidatus Weimeria sp. HCP3S3_B5]|jgi:flagellar hook-basal body complex protein FliE|uniref:flagellar hook-basal body complex protein FliE n=1 Tax=Candidatus Weimeria sp. HCP3S3_B5 TaxID=3438871 RepID=UPI002A9E3333|nr:flagellar hook-basal body complex protein FliE [Lachnospiraceae bacterium]MDY6352615.1 flagellar hook-basal body complex protein FliE [Lachnospiraceae bacterium]
MTGVTSIEAANAGYKTAPQRSGIDPDKNTDFGSVFDAAVNLVDETNTLQNKANAEQVKFALGLSDNTHDMMIALQKAKIALQYTSAIRSTCVQAYQTIMNMQI